MLVVKKVVGPQKYFDQARAILKKQQMKMKRSDL